LDNMFIREVKLMVQAVKEKFTKQFSIGIR
jgi:hypothetical protein